MIDHSLGGPEGGLERGPEEMLYLYRVTWRFYSVTLDTRVCSGIPFWLKKTPSRKQGKYNLLLENWIFPWSKELKWFFSNLKATHKFANDDFQSRKQLCDHSLVLLK